MKVPSLSLFSLLFLVLVLTCAVLADDDDDVGMFVTKGELRKE
jgi:hypothetical protein